MLLREMQAATSGRDSDEGGRAVRLPTFDQPFETLDRRHLLEWNRECGRSARAAKWQFLATLPEIDRIESFRDAGFRSVFELAEVRGAVSRRDVEDVLILYKRVGRYWVLWRLFAAGQVGMSKLMLISRHVTADNAAWWAEQVVSCSRVQLKALIAAMQHANAGLAERTGDLTGSACSLVESAGGQIEHAGSQSTDQRRGAESEDRPPDGMTTALAGGSAGPAGGSAGPASGSAGAASGSAGAAGGSAGPAGGSAGAAADPALLAAGASVAGMGPAGGSRQGSGGEGAADPGGVWSSEEGPEAHKAPRSEFPRRVRVTVEMTDYGAKQLDELRDLYERGHGPISKGELLERLVLDALCRGQVPGPGSGTVAGPASGTVAGPASGTAAPETGRESGPMGASPVIDCGAISARDAGAKSLPARRMLEVVYRNADTGARWLPSRHGPIPLESLPREERDRLGSAPLVAFEELRARALAASARHERNLAPRLVTLRQAGKAIPPDLGRDVPAAVATYLMARSGGLCEGSGCQGRAAHFHHLDPFCVHHCHHIDRMLVVCPFHHDALHSGLLVPDPDDQRVLRPLSPGATLARSPVDAKVQAAKLRATAAGRTESG